MIGAAIKFCAVGVFVAALDFGMLWLLEPLVPRLWAVSFAYLIGVTTHFCLNKWWVFASRRQLHTAEIARYVVMVIVCWLCTVIVVWAALKLVTSNVFLAKLIAMGPATLVAFTMMRRFVFRP